MHNLTNEHIILNASLLSIKNIQLVMDYIKSEDAFYGDNNKKLFKVMKSLYDAGKEVNYASVGKVLTEQKQDISILFNKINDYWTGNDIQPYIESLLDDYNRRQIQFLLKKQNELIEDKGNSVESITGEIDSRMREITANQVSSITLLSEMKTGDIYDLGSDKKVRKTGYKGVDESLWGIGAGELIVLAAQTSHGKTSIAGNMATFIADKYDDYVLWFSLEMPKEQMRRRFVAQYAEYDNLKIKIKRYDSDVDKEKVKAAMIKVDNLSIGLVDNKFEIKEIVSTSRKFSHRYKISLIVVDYLQQISNFIPGTSVAQQIGGSVKGLKDIAMELQVPLICLSQFSRKSDPEEYPDLSWLKESSTIEQAADMVWFLHRYSEKQKAKQEDEYLFHVENLYRFMVAKNRDGKANFHVNMKFIPEYTRFEEV